MFPAWGWLGSADAREDFLHLGMTQTQSCSAQKKEVRGPKQLTAGRGSQRSCESATKIAINRKGRRARKYRHKWRVQTKEVRDEATNFRGRRGSQRSCESATKIAIDRKGRRARKPSFKIPNQIQTQMKESKQRREWKNEEWRRARFLRTGEWEATAKGGEGENSKPAQRAVAASGTCAERQNGKKKQEGNSPVQKMRGPGLESGTKHTQNRPKWLLEEERVPGVGCETFFREEKQQKRPKCREEIERIDLCDWGKPTFLGKSPNWRLQDLVPKYT